ncbi:MAG: hypothetical protein EOO22_00785 [Comamonadaceae bacterium]|nr:MAG: hypothetical protein EOO22_00785 [Comamonadaceae bacterium]
MIKKLINHVLSGALMLSSGLASAAGYIGGYNKGFMDGWGCDQLDPDHQSEIQIWRDDNILLATTTANQVREVQVAFACGSTHSTHGFVIAGDLPTALMDNSNHKVHVFVISRFTPPQELSNSPVNIFFGEAPSTSAPTAPTLQPSPSKPMINHYLGPAPALPSTQNWPVCKNGYSCDW